MLATKLPYFKENLIKIQCVCFTLLLLSGLILWGPYKLKVHTFQRYDDLYFQYITHSFWVQHFINGELSLKAFQDFLGQDVLYLKAYEQASRIIASRFSQNDPRRAFFEKYAEKTMKERKWLLQELKKNHCPIPSHKALINEAYSNYLLHIARYGTLAEAVAALLPCHTLWERLSSYLYAHFKHKEHGLYWEWELMLNEPEVHEETESILTIEDSLLAEESELTYLLAGAAYQTSAYFEVGFFKYVVPLV